MEAEQIRADAAQLASFGYRQQLTRALGLWSNFSLGFTYLSPVVGVYTLFAFGLATAGPAFIWTIPIVVAGQFLVVLTFGEVTSQYPIAGGIYQWCKQLLGDRYAWFAGWFYIWALLVTIASVAFGAVPYIGALFGFTVTSGNTKVIAVPSFGDVISGKNGNPIIAVINAALGHAGSKVALTMVIIAFVSCTLAIQAAAIRLIFSYARDEMIFGWKPLSTVSARFHMPPGAVAVAAVIPAAMTLLNAATVARIITFAVVGIYISFQLVVLAGLIARQRGWRAAGAFTLGRYGLLVNLTAFVYGVAAIVILSIKTPHAAGAGFFDRWLVPISAAIVGAVGLAYLLVFKPKAVVRPDARVEGSGAEPVEAPAVPAH